MMLRPRSKRVRSPYDARIYCQGGVSPLACRIRKSVTVIVWDSVDQAVAYFSSLPFKELQSLRDKAAKVRNFHVEGVAR
jgi:uncharacterized protein (DUF1330 family)